MFLKSISKRVSPLIRAVRNGLIIIIPSLLIGSISLMLISLPIDGYQEFLHSFLNGSIFNFFNLVQKVALGTVSFQAAISIGFVYIRAIYPKRETFYMGGILSILAAYSITIGFFNPGFSNSYFGGKGMFASLLAAFVGGKIHTLIRKRVEIKTQRKYTEGADAIFDTVLRETLPIAAVIFIFAAFTELCGIFLGANSIIDAFIVLVNKIFRASGSDFLNGSIFVVFLTFLWFLGIHGSNVLENTAQSIFSNFGPDIIVSRNFIDVFVLMGGSGTMLSLVLSTMIFSSRKSLRRHGQISLLPGIFNISELMMFGVPVVYNVYLLIPFILVPLFCFITSYIATATGFIPCITKSTEWTTPVLLSGYIATGSIKAGFLQIFNLICGVVIYMPFVRLNDRKSRENQKEYLNELIDTLKESEKSLVPVSLLDEDDEKGFVAKMVLNDLKDYVEQEKVDVKFQPQCNETGNIIGSEALLRWNHPLFGMIYPPLVIKLAKESDILWKLEKKIFETCVSQYSQFREKFGDTFKLSINATVESLYNPDFIRFLEEMVSKYSINRGNICVEITEESVMETDRRTSDLFDKIHEMGYYLAMDDFSMGHTSISYLMNSHFDFVKLDGKIVKEIETNERSREIITSIVNLASSLKFRVIAEYVETESEKNLLESLGVKIYQGYFYGPGLPIEKILEWKNK